MYNKYNEIFVSGLIFTFCNHNTDLLQQIDKINILGEVLVCFSFMLYKVESVK